MRVCVQLGFRHTEVRHAQLYHNGARVMLRGVNRHEFDDRCAARLRLH